MKLKLVMEFAQYLITPGKFDEAMKKLEKGLGYAKGDHDLESTLVAICLDEAKRLAEGDKKEDIEKAIKVLERGRKSFSKNKQLKENLAIRYANRARILNNSNNYEAAVEDLWRALDIDKDSGLALKALPIITRNCAIPLHNSGRSDRAMEVLAKSRRYSDSEELKRLESELRRARGEHGAMNEQDIMDILKKLGK